MDPNEHLTKKLDKASELLESYGDRDRRRLETIASLNETVTQLRGAISEHEQDAKDAAAILAMRGKFEQQNRVISELQLKCAKLEQQVSG